MPHNRALTAACAYDQRGVGQVQKLSRQKTFANFVDFRMPRKFFFAKFSAGLHSHFLSRKLLLLEVSRKFFVAKVWVEL